MEERGQAEYDPKLAIPMSELVFVQSPDTRVTVLLRWDDNAVCTGGGVWLAQAMRWREGLLELRKYDMQGSLQHSLLVSLPPAPSPEDYAVFMQHRLTERNGNIEFAYLARSGNRPRLEHYRVKL